jgi:hypothetical protein
MKYAIKAGKMIWSLFVYRNKSIFIETGLGWQIGWFGSYRTLIQI